MTHHADFIRDRLGELLEKCRATGTAVTPQRLAVYRALLETGEHPTPEALYRKVREEMPSLSLATIYKSLRALEKLGAVTELPSLTHGRRFDANTGRHHHLLCTSCRKVTDYHDAGLDRLKPPRSVPGFHPESVSVQILGLCSACARVAKSRSRPSAPARPATKRTTQPARKKKET